MEHPRKQSRIKVVTFNIWFEDYETKLRHDALLEILRSQDADVIGLQEVTPPFLSRLRELEGYHLFDVDVVGYGIAVLSRNPARFSRIHLPSSFGRKLVVAELEDLAVGVVHLESLRENRRSRKQQLEQIFPTLASYDNAVLMGDFNLCSTSPENANLDPAYLDLWAALRPSEAGWTESTDENLMRLVVTKKPKSVRFDRVLLRSGVWAPESIDRLGTQPVDTDHPEVFPSDHFGLAAVLKRSR